MTTNEELHARFEAQRLQADRDSRGQITNDAFLSHPSKFQLSFEESELNNDVVASVFEWGEFREDVSLSDSDAIALRDWLIKRFPLEGTKEDDK